MKILLLVLFLFSTSSRSAPLNMKPGLWQVDMKMNMDGKEYDPMAEMNKHMKNMSKKQREAIMKQMGAAGNPNSLSGQKVCYSEKMIKDPQGIGKHQKPDCDYKTTSSTSSRVVANYTCKDGAKGDVLWETKDSKHLEMKMNSTDKDGKKMKMEYMAKFIDSNCGEVKPYL